MTSVLKSRSPFHPGQPVPVELFVGRAEQIHRILERGVGQVAAGKPVAMFVQGEYGIGKSSIAGLVQRRAEETPGLHGIYASLGAARTMADVGAAVLEATVRSGAFFPSRSEKVRHWLSRYLGEQSLFGLTLHADVLKKDAPTVASGMLPFLQEVMTRLGDTGIRGVFLVLDEINGITGDAKFAHFIKSLVDTNALSRKPLPLLLLLCGVEERRREMIRHHQPVERVFDVIDIETLKPQEMENFFRRAFDSVKMEIEADALKTLVMYSAGFPKIMHLLGDAAFWIDKDGIIDHDDALEAVLAAADEVGKKYVDQQVYWALRSQDYHSILRKIAQRGPRWSFQKAEVAKGLTDKEKKKFGNFLQRMKKLNVLRLGEAKGEWVFNQRMVSTFIWLDNTRKRT